MWASRTFAWHARVQRKSRVRKLFRVRRRQPKPARWPKLTFGVGVVGTYAGSCLRLSRSCRRHHNIRHNIRCGATVLCRESPESNALSDKLFDLATLGVDNKLGRCGLVHNRHLVNYPAVCLFKTSADGFSRAFLFCQSSCRGKVD